MKSIVVEAKEWERAFDETLLKIERALREEPKLSDPFRTVNYYVRELKSRLEGA